MAARSRRVPPVAGRPARRARSPPPAVETPEAGRRADPSNCRDGTANHTDIILITTTSARSRSRSCHCRSHPDPRVGIAAASLLEVMAAWRCSGSSTVLARVHRGAAPRRARPLEASLIADTKSPIPSPRSAVARCAAARLSEATGETSPLST
jgi:hypothetical protein